MDFDNIVYDEVNYNCVHFLIDIVKYYTNIDLSDEILVNNQVDPNKLKNFKEIPKPTRQCLVLFRSPNRNHVGFWRDNRVIHLCDNGVVSQPLSVAKCDFNRVEFYEIKPY